jgi:hypothetical protein
MSAGDRTWLATSLERWQFAGKAWLGLKPVPLPTVVAIDARCRYELIHGSFASITAERHDGKVLRIGDHDVPIGPISFADGSDRFVMSLPSVWRAAGVRSDAGLEQLMTGVLLHEVMHTRQAHLATAALAGLGDDAGDDLVQDRFKSDPDYVAAYRHERDTLYAAAAAPRLAEARRLAGEALDLMKARRARWFTAADARDAALEDVFLTMEGVGQYMLHRQLASAPGVSQATALAETRRGDQWTQDEGYALVAVLQRLLPDWRARAFREPDWRAINLLTAAAHGG